MSSRGDLVFRWTIIGISSLILIIAGLYAVQLALGGAGAFAQFGVFGFLFGTDWDPVQEKFNALPFIIGTLLTAFGALIIAVPLALASALFITEYAPRWLAEPIGYLIELLAAIPSVVYGLWAVFVLVPIVRSVELWLVTTLNLNWAPIGVGLPSAIIVLAIMIVPFIASIARDVIRLVPVDQREAAYALGATKWEVIRTAIIPYARAGILGGVILGLGRAIGETLAVTMVIGNANRIPQHPFDQAATLSSLIASNFNEAIGETLVSSLIAIGLVLFVLSLAVNLVARLIIIRLTPKGTR